MAYDLGRHGSSDISTHLSPLKEVKDFFLTHSAPVLRTSRLIVAYEKAGRSSQVAVKERSAAAVLMMSILGFFSIFLKTCMTEAGLQRHTGFARPLLLSTFFSISGVCFGCSLGVASACLLPLCSVCVPRPSGSRCCTAVHWRGDTAPDEEHLLFGKSLHIRYQKCITDSELCFINSRLKRSHACATVVMRLRGSITIEGVLIHASDACYVRLIKTRDELLTNTEV
ncbi:hypothetical protein TGME49_233670 [Toxoplasma gondii ME49]|uniref:Transmembrane protein n=4 Tax=Toxoplasma gondii TaxID=5811 RepID=A0A125YKU1_TOXGM|nr:hypothetical protein TGME49_233670 [Toxoplasma gondii ME49]ESS35898.1 putative transmembrane protein [Toxoplasma gondii VEG]KYF46328.1 hypothetical protein TGARI_233670 [Toxoplasma gondii ARI]PIM04177.1 putative transmembrane protein [Toxoplasma gondii COUG]EPT28753.1 hypothetical protein TGME49_233670 [Toxoplasma gondii ME49]CEL75018.1 TPA: hypothetical protein BN1205_021850 [Toxoplasma gondii VEG]|eukprot:XP_002368216.1 hypothetical protein TGME49_233670 [Toxoplasma gondii ME49]